MERLVNTLSYALKGSHSLRATRCCQRGLFTHTAGNNLNLKLRSNSAAILSDTILSSQQSQSHYHTTCQHKLHLGRQSGLVQREIQAFTSLLNRSGFRSTEDLLQLLGAGERKCFSTSAVQRQYPPPKDDENNKENEPEEDEKMPFLARLMLMVWLGFLVFVILRLQSGEDNGSLRYVSWNEFVYDMLAKGEVSEVIVRPESEVAFIRLHPGAVVKGRRVDTDMFSMKIADPNKFEDKVRKAEAELGLQSGKGVNILFQRENSWAPLIFMAMAALAVFFVFKHVVKIQLPNASDMFASERKAKFVRADLLNPKNRGINFKDVAGLHEAKVEVMEFVDYLKRPDKYTELGGKIPRGALLLGPPGCGKTLLAKAVATEAQVPFLAMAGSEFVEMLGGLGAARVRDLFKEARQNAPCIIYVDEIDAIGRKRSGNNWSDSSEEEHTLNQLLVELDGMGTQQGVIMLASTNRPDVLDKALLRPGRFDRHIMIDLPTLAERKEIFGIYLSKLRLSHQPSHFSDRLAQLSPGMSGADIANICNESALHAARHKKKMISTDDFEYAVERVVAGVAKKSRVLSQLEKKVVAYHEAGHAVVGWLLEHTDALLRVSIVPRTSAALGFAQYMPTDRNLHSQEELFERMCMAMGGRVAESLTFNRVTSGAQDDLRRITDMAYAQVRELGMNDRVGPLSFPPKEDGAFGSRPYSKQLARVIDDESRMMIAKAYQATEKLLSDNKEKLRVIAEALLEKEALGYKDIEQLIGPPPYGIKGVATSWDTSAPLDPTFPPMPSPPTPPPTAS